MVAKEHRRNKDKPGAKQQRSLPKNANSAFLEQKLVPDAVVRQAARDPGSLLPAEVLQLQRAIGNRAVRELLETHEQVQSTQGPQLDPQGSGRLVGAHELSSDLHQTGVIQRKLKKRDRKIKKRVDDLVKNGKHDEALELICKKYGFTGKNFEIKVVPAMADAWATTGGEIKAGAKQTLSIGKDLFAEKFTFIVRTIGHEFQHLKQRSQKKPIKNQKEREFLAWAWEALDKSVPTYSKKVAAKHAKKALEYYKDMPKKRKKRYKKKVRALKRLIKRAK